MAAAWFNRLCDPSKACALSAGTEPAARVHPNVVAAMREVGFDLSTAPTSRLTATLTESVDMLITMGCGEQCPVVPGVERQDWPLPDPKDQPIARVREIRDEIRERVSTLLASRHWRKAAPAPGSSE